MAEFAYHSRKNLDTGEWQGLLRFDPANARYTYAKDGKWVAGDPDRLEMFVAPGADAPELVDRAVAERLAFRYRVKLPRVATCSHVGGAHRSPVSHTFRWLTAAR